MIFSLFKSKLTRIDRDASSCIAEPWSHIVEYWRKSGVPIRQAATLEMIDSFQKRYSVLLPPDLLEYLLVVDGTGTEYSDDLVTSFHPIADFKPVHEYVGEPKIPACSVHDAYSDCYVFADHMIDSWLYAVELTADPTQPGRVFRVLDHRVQDIPMAGSFREFMNSYASDPGNIL